MAKEKVQFTLDKELMEQLDDYCDVNHMNRSQCITQALVKVFNEQKVIDTMYNVSIAVKKSVDTNTLDEDTMIQLRDFETLCKLMLGTK